MNFERKTLIDYSYKNSVDEFIKNISSNIM